MPSNCSKEFTLPIVSQVKSPAMPDTDHELDWIRKSQTGDADAFEELVKRHQRMIHALTYRMTGSIRAR